MKFIKPYLCVAILVTMNAMVLTANAAEPVEKPIKKPVTVPTTVNQPQIKNPSALSPAEVNNLRKELRQHNIEFSKYMDILKQHRIKAKDMQIVRTQTNARARTNIRSQNHEWEGTYDCDDMDATVKPGQVEACDGIDNNCNGKIDEGVTANLFLDADGDGWGDSDKIIKACHVEAGYAARGNDCDDRNIQIYPGAADVEGDGIDANCDGNDG